MVYNDIQSVEMEADALLGNICRTGRLKKEYDNTGGEITHKLLNTVVDFIQYNALYDPRVGYCLDFFSPTKEMRFISEEDMKALKRYRAYLKK